MKNLLEKLAVLAKIKGLTQQQIADLTGISRISVNRFFNGKTDIAASDFVNILKILEIDVPVLVEKKLECKLNGDSSASDPVYTDVATVLENLEPDVRNTLLEQITWWGTLLPKKSIQEIVERVKRHLSQTARQTT